MSMFLYRGYLKREFQVRQFCSRLSYLTLATSSSMFSSVSSNNNHFGNCQKENLLHKASIFHRYLLRNKFVGILGKTSLPYFDGNCLFR